MPPKPLHLLPSFSPGLLQTQPPWNCPWQGLPRCTLPVCSAPLAAWVKRLPSYSHHHPPFHLVHGQVQRGSTGSAWGCDRTLVLGCHRGLERTGQGRVMPCFGSSPKEHAGKSCKGQIVPYLLARLSSAQPKQAPKTRKTAWARDSAFWTPWDKPTVVITHRLCSTAWARARQLQSPGLL